MFETWSSKIKLSLNIRRKASPCMLHVMHFYLYIVNKDNKNYISISRNFLFLMQIITYFVISTIQLNSNSFNLHLWYISFTNCLAIHGTFCKSNNCTIKLSPTGVLMTIFILYLQTFLCSFVCWKHSNNSLRYFWLQISYRIIDYPIHTFCRWIYSRFFVNIHLIKHY